MSNLPAVTVNHLPYTDSLEPRSLDSIQLVVIHCTELPDLSTAREYGERVHYPSSGTGNSGHFYIEQNGDIEQWVPIDRIAHHVKDYNRRSLGIELVNIGRYPDWFDSRNQVMKEPYPPAQISALLNLLDTLQEVIPTLKQISGHSSLDTSRVPASDNAGKTVHRKRDPGPEFPWEPVLSHSLLEWFESAPG